MPIQVTRSFLPTLEEYINEISDIWESHWLTNMGIKHQELEEALSKYLGTPFVTLFANGHLALECAIETFNLSGEVITTPFTFASTTHALVRNGLEPVFCDIHLDNYTMDTDRLENLITDRTSAVHVYGNLCDWDKIGRIAQKYGLKVIYDAAHAFGVTVNGEGVGNFGDASMFSFHATKVFHTIEGGAVTYKNKDLKTTFYGIKNFGIMEPESVEYIGTNAKMNEFQAAMGLCNLRHIDEEIKKRRIVVERYQKNLRGINGIRLNLVQEGVKSNYAYFPVLFDGYKMNRNQVYEVLKAKDILARKYFYPLTYNYQCYQDRFPNPQTPVAEFVADRILTLPLYADLALEDVDRVCDIILG